MGIPLELLSMLGSTILGGILQIWGMKVKARAEQHKQTMDALTMQNEIFNSAAKRAEGNPNFQFTRRTIAISAVFAILVLPKLMAFIAPIFGWDIAVTYGWTQIEEGFWFWSDDVETLSWQTAEGMVITPLDTHVVSSIIGLYFGSSVVKNV